MTGFLPDFTMSGLPRKNIANRANRSAPASRK
jgi:hypothetical protein